MSVVPQDFLDSAQHLLDQNPSREIDWRNAASRAYYALYHFARIYAEQNLISPSTYSDTTHKRLIQLYLDAGKSDMWLLSVGYIIKNARNIRTNADYKCNLDFMRSDACSVLADFQRVTQQLET